MQLPVCKANEQSSRPSRSCKKIQNMSVGGGQAGVSRGRGAYVLGGKLYRLPLGDVERQRCAPLSARTVRGTSARSTQDCIRRICHSPSHANIGVGQCMTVGFNVTYGVIFSDAHCDTCFRW